MIYELDEWSRAIFELTPTWPNFDFGNLLVWIGSNNDHLWLPRSRATVFEQCSNWLQLDLIARLLSFPCKLGINNDPIWFVNARRVILAMFELIPSWPNYTFCKLFMWNGTNSHLSFCAMFEPTAPLKIWSLFAPIYMKSWPKVKLGQVGSRFEHSSKSLAWSQGSHIWLLYMPQFTLLKITWLAGQLIMKILHFKELVDTYKCRHEHPFGVYLVDDK